MIRAVGKTSFFATLNEIFIFHQGSLELFPYERRIGPPSQKLWFDRVFCLGTRNFTANAPEMDDWKTIRLPFGFVERPIFRGELLNLQGVTFQSGDVF